jgi:hypothetical protein
LGVDDGGKGALVAWWQGRACLLRPGQHERALGGLGLRKRGRGAWLEQALAGGVLGLSWAAAQCWLGSEVAGVRERGSVRSWQDCLGLPPSFCVQPHETKRIREGKRESGGRLGCLLVDFAKKEEKRKEKEKDWMNLAEIHLNFEKF